MSRANNPNIVQYVEAGMAKTKDVYWIVMELLHGDSLERYLQDHGSLPEVEVIKVVSDLDLRLHCNTCTFEIFDVPSLHNARFSKSFMLEDFW